MQDEHPVGYASRALTPKETNYAQIEKELLAIVFEVERFEGYDVYGRKIFELDVSHRKGTEMHMADPLRRAYLPLVKQDMMDTREVWNVADPRSPTEVETQYVDMAESVPIRKLTLQEIKSATEVDAELQALVLIITQG